MEKPELTGCMFTDVCLWLDLYGKAHIKKLEREERKRRKIAKLLQKIRKIKEMKNVRWKMG